jgi:hypothetical protein
MRFSPNGDTPEQSQAQGLGRVIMRLRGDLAPVAEGLRNV